MAEVKKKEGYYNGSDLLMTIEDGAYGHCTSHTIAYNSETKERAVKPLAKKGRKAGLWKNKGVVGLSISINAEGLRFYQETESGYKVCRSLWKEGKSVTVKAYERNESEGELTEPYLVGKFVITSLEESAPAQDDVTYSISLENDGEPDSFDDDVISEGAAE